MTIQPPSSSSLTENFRPADEVLTVNDANKKKQPQQPRQLLSCTKCRERKVKASSPKKTTGTQCLSPYSQLTHIRSVIAPSLAQRAALVGSRKSATLWLPRAATTALSNSPTSFVNCAQRISA